MVNSLILCGLSEHTIRSQGREPTRHGIHTKSSRARIHTLCVTRYTHLDNHIIVRTHAHLDTHTCDNHKTG